ncbi:hypothetical protein A1O3_06421 [Capronia epimyces CBS 606.96]|uniref:C2H2-type domain-containing protein n=1 Tax=Capronia epimyces CBS 606.96 TaxID=1182542 RepID=W9XQV7_9EURO|nr:uncharacterized protein A1O3_06421 [Capronia epimyces CBS 606.96]EXJ82608.1 hypothetical protein A1O3_06421 [Capronia epimyces CBS 606.96]
MRYPSLSVAQSTYTVPVMSSMVGYDSDPTFEFLTDDVLSGTSTTDLNMASSSYQGQGQTPDLLNSGYMPMETGIYTSGMMNNFFSPDLSWQNRVLTPPPEDYVQEILPHSFLSAQDYEPEPYQGDRNLAAFGTNVTPKSPSYRVAQRSPVQPRPIRSASERSDSSGEHATVHVEAPALRDDTVDKVKARSDPLYDTKADKDGWYHCPMFIEAKCAHKPTKQRCIYNKYLDSHLRPYRCKFADRPECEDARFSSNACLFRHEREAHGLHNHGLNPFLCKFPDCDRARDGNGFPRRWNQRDHMKRVHDYVEEDSPRDRTTTPDQPKRRKVPDTLTSTPMKRTGSSALARAQAIAGATVQPRYYGRTVSQARYSTPCMYAG